MTLNHANFTLNHANLGVRAAKISPQLGAHNHWIKPHLAEFLWSHIWGTMMWARSVERICLVYGPLPKGPKDWTNSRSPSRMETFNRDWTSQARLIPNPFFSWGLPKVEIETFKRNWKFQAWLIIFNLWALGGFPWHYMCLKMILWLGLVWLFCGNSDPCLHQTKQEGQLDKVFVSWKKAICKKVSAPLLAILDGCVLNSRQNLLRNASSVNKRERVKPLRIDNGSCEFNSHDPTFYVFFVPPFFLSKNSPRFDRLISANFG